MWGKFIIGLKIVVNDLGVVICLLMNKSIEVDESIICEKKVVLIMFFWY